MKSGSDAEVAELLLRIAKRTTSLLALLILKVGL
jgi:hypothetical protein